MADNQKPAIELNVPVEVAETNKESQAPADAHPDMGGMEEMPTITTLLQRKKLGAAKSAPAKPAASAPAPKVDIAPAAAPVAAVEVPSIDFSTPSTSAAEAAPSLSIEPAAPVEISVAPVVAPVVAPAAEAAPEAAESAPVVAPAPRRRAAAKVAVADDSAASAVTSAAAPVARAAGRPGEPPAFSGALMLESLDIKNFEKMLKKHKKSANLKKLDCLGYFSTRFTEIAYFEVSQPGALQGVLGFGNPALVSAIRSQAITPQVLPSIFEVLAQGEVFVGAVESLRAEDQQGLASLGFGVTSVIGAFPMIYKKAVTGLWICTSIQLDEITPKELKALKKLLTDLTF